LPAFDLRFRNFVAIFTIAIPMPIPSKTEVLQFIARNEPLGKTLARYPEITREQLCSLLRDAALLFHAEGKGITPVEKLAELAESTLQPLEPALIPSKARKIRVFSDGASRGNPGPAGAGAVLIGDDGTIIAKIGKFLGNQTNNYAEYMGFLIGMEHALRQGATDVEAIADSELLVRQLQGTYRVKSENIRPLFEQAKQLLSRFRVATIRHVPRKENQLADEMSNRAIDEQL
jgi:ribonuclease HI